MIDNFHLQDGKVEFRWRRWRNKKRQEVSACLMVLFGGVVLLGGGGIAEAGPTGGQVIGGQGNIAYGGATTTIKQQSQVISINWQTFSTARNETVNFNQPNTSSLAINYVVGGVPSVLQGALNADGRVYILNSAGITFTGTSHVNVGALLATTAMTIDGDPTKKIDVKGSGSGRVINQGSIQVSDGGFAILAAPYVENTGFIKADLGTIALAGTNKFTLDLRGDGLINFVVPPEAVEKIKSDGTRVGVNNTGTLQARSGQVLISASVATQVVNAAVNMSGVVDASAFAPNGQGGSVLVTSEGDINLGGQVSANGAGTGAGGQIITKAVGADNVNRKAVMTAAGGNGGGQGGQIEVSGHDVLLSGDINPGSGGTLLIDPFNVIVTATKGFNDVAGATVSEAFISKQLRHNVTVDIQASHDIVFVAAGNSHMLVGGNGNLTLDAANDIIFSANDYVIQTKAGAVTLTAGGDIGDPAHRLSVVSGEGNHGPGVNAAGDIVLAAGNDIYVDTITATASRKGKVTASFSADAGGTFSAAGLIDVEAMAKGKGSQQASAAIHITAGNDLILHGLTDLAAVQSRGKGGNLAAVADVDLSGGNLTDTSNVVVQAAIAGRVAHSVLADANLLLTAASAVQINGNMDVAALANLSSADLVTAHALTEIGGNDVTVGAVNVGALASDRGSGNAAASALVSIHGSGSQQFPPFPATLSLGSLTDRASANVNGGGAAKSLADVTIQMPGVVQVAGAIDVSANAHNFGGGPKGSSGVAASANAELAFPGGETAVAQDITVGGAISVIADGTNSGSGGVKARGRFGLAESGAGVQLGDVLVDAVALNKGSHANGAAVASAAFSPSGFVGAGFNVNSVNVQALASNLGMGGARAMAIGRLEAGSGPGGPPSISVPGGVSVDAAAVTGPNAHSNASALASLSLSATGDHAVIGAGRIDVEAHASDYGAGNAVASAPARLEAFDGIEGASLGVGALTDVASANNWGGGVAVALANATLIASATFPAGPSISGNVLIAANAHDYSGVSASANADFLLGGSLIGVNGDISVISRATNDQDGKAKSRAAVAVGTVANASSIHIANLLVDALASERGAGAASASALTGIRAQLGSGSFGHSGNGNIAMGALTDRASAVSLGGGKAKALADATLQAAGALQVAGPIAVSADAYNSGDAAAPAGGIAASANADITLVAGPLGEHTLSAGDISVTAQGTNLGGGGVRAQGRLHATGGTGTGGTGTGGTGTGGIGLGNVLIDVTGLNAGEGGANGALATASLDAHGASLRLGAIDVQARASDHGAGDAVASALTNLVAVGAAFGGSSFGGSAGLSVGSLTDIASAQNWGGGSAKALANAVARAGGRSFDGNLGVSPVVQARASDHGAGDAVASALTDLTASGSLSGRLGASLTDIASAENWGGGSAKALANVVGQAFGMFGNLSVSAVDVQARANDHGAGDAVASALTDLAGLGSHATAEVGSLIDIASAENWGGGSAKALAVAGVRAGGDFVEADIGKIDVQARASDHGTGDAVASALTDPRASGLFGGAGLGVGSLTDIASANNWGGGSAKALANAASRSLNARAIDVGGDILVTANAHDFSGAAATANAGLALKAIGFGTALVTVDGDISVIVHATNDADGEARSRAAVDISGSAIFDQIPGASVHIANLLVDALASERGAGAASASALTGIRAHFGSGSGHSGSYNIAMGALTERASAVNLGGGTAKALADATLQAASQVQVGGDILVSANAQFIGGSGGGAASANAALAILSSGNVTIDGNVEVLSRATGASVDAAEANTLILANLTTGSIFINGRVTDLATASGGSDHALAVLKMDARNITSGGELGLGDPIVRAKAGSAVAEWLVDSSGTAASDGAFVRVNIPPGF